MKVAPSHCHWDLARTIWYLRRDKMQITFLPHLHMAQSLVRRPSKPGGIHFLLEILCLCPDTRPEVRMGTIQTLFRSLLGPCSCMAPRLA
jgi:hypothetical protein